MTPPAMGRGHPLPTPHVLGGSILTSPILKFCLRYCLEGREMSVDYRVKD